MHLHLLYLNENMSALSRVGNPTFRGTDTVSDNTKTFDASSPDTRKHAAEAAVELSLSNRGFDKGVIHLDTAAAQDPDLGCKPHLASAIPSGQSAAYVVWNCPSSNQRWCFSASSCRLTGLVVMCEEKR